MATIIGVFLMLLTTKPFGWFVPTPSPTPQPITYQAVKPGVGCDGGEGKWINQIESVDTHLYGAAECDSKGLKITNFAGYSNEAPQIVFQWPNHQFSNVYTVEVDIASQTSNGCGGIITHGQSLDTPGEYVYLICPNGTWQMLIASTTDGSFSELKSGQVSVETTYHMQVMVNGPTHTLEIDGNDRIPVVDSTYTTTSYIGLVVSGYPSENDESATFAHFTYSGMR